MAVGFTYLDPPYVNRGTDLYFANFEERDHRDLSDFLRDYRNAFLLSYDDLIMELYSNFFIEEIKGNYPGHRTPGRIYTSVEFLIYKPRTRTPKNRYQSADRASTLPECLIQSDPCALSRGSTGGQ